MTRVTVVIISWNTRELLAQCIRSVRQTCDASDTAILVADNASVDGSPEMLEREFPDVRLLRNPDNLGFAAANNQAVATCDSPYVLLLNSDAQLTAGALQALLSTAEAQPRAAVVGASVYYPDGRFQASFAAFPSFGQELLMLSGLGRLLYGPWYPNQTADPQHAARRVDWVSGACMLVRRAAFTEVGGFDNRFFLYAEEVDLCYTLRQRAWETWYTPAARVLHVGSASSSGRALEREAQLYRSRVRFFSKHYGDGAAAALRALMLAVTAIKIPAHGLARALSGGKLGRPVLSLGQLARQLRER